MRVAQSCGSPEVEAPERSRAVCGGAVGRRQAGGVGETL